MAALAQLAESMSQIGKSLSVCVSTAVAMNDDAQKFADIKSLARMAARLAGRDPDEHVMVRVGEVVVFSDAAWRYPDFIDRAEAAYDLLHRSAGFEAGASVPLIG